ncbi:hypothetical protein C8R44DRAFT_537223, partial [Mycena epipterygia]
PFIQNVLLQDKQGRETTLWAVFDDGAMANAIDEGAYQAAQGTLGELAPSQRVLRMADGGLVPSKGLWCGNVTVSGVHRRGQFEVFLSGGAWAMLFGKPLLEEFRAWHGYKEDAIVLPDGAATVEVAN